MRPDFAQFSIKVSKGVSLGSDAVSNILDIILCNCLASSGFEYADEWNIFLLDVLVLEELRKSSTGGGGIR